MESFLNWTISQILDIYPETKEVFIHHGFPQLADDDTLRQLGAILKLKTALKSRRLDESAFIALLKEKIEEHRQFRQFSSLSPDRPADRLNLLALLPCPLKVPLESEFTRLLEHLHQKKGLSLNVCIDSHGNNEWNYEDIARYFEDPDELPDVLLTAGYNFLRKTFMDRFVQKGVFARLPRQTVNSSLLEAGMIDPEGHFTLIGVNVLVMAVDTGRLGSLPTPTRWSDLLNPLYKKQVVMRGHGDTFCDIVQLNFYNDHGTAGVAQLGRAVRYGLHPAQMVKELAGSRSGIPPIHIMPYFFARTLPARTSLKIVWPEDGALAYPVSLLVKADKAEELKDLTDFLTGPQVARIFNGAFFPAALDEANSLLPSAQKLKWPGWDTLKNANWEQLVEDLNRQFLAAHRGEGNPCS